MLTKSDGCGVELGQVHNADGPFLGIPRQPVLELDTFGFVAMLEDVTVVAEAGLQHEAMIDHHEKVKAVLNGGRIFNQHLQEGLWQLVRVVIDDFSGTGSSCGSGCGIPSPGWDPFSSPSPLLEERRATPLR